MTERISIKNAIIQARVLDPDDDEFDDEQFHIMVPYNAKLRWLIDVGALVEVGNLRLCNAF